MDLGMKKKIIALATGGLVYFSAASMAFAQVGVQIKPPDQGVNPGAGVGNVLSNALTIVFIVAAIIVLFFLVLGAFQWITSAGDKEKVKQARGTIIHALTGFAILALSLLIITVVGQIVNLNILKLNYIPTLDKTCSKTEVFDPESGECKAPRQ